MKSIKNLAILLFILLISSCSSSDNDIDINDQSLIENEIIESINTNSTSENTTLTENERDDILYLREEEKLARDVYLNSFNKYGLKIFSNIASSEETHMKNVLSLITKYGLEDSASEEIGVFNNSELQQLYNQLVEKSNISLIDALIIGNTIEDLDIYDLELNEERTTKTDLLNVYSSLKCGSRNHLRNYYEQLTNNIGNYSPQYISQELFNNIINTSNEKCGNN